MQNPGLKNKSLAMLILLLTLLFSVTACSLHSDSKDTPETAPTNASQRTPLTEEHEATAVTVYYTTPDHEYLLPLTVSVNATREVAKIAIEKLLAGAPDQFSAAVIPEGTKLKSLYVINQTVYVDMTQEFLNIDPENAQMAVDALVATVLPLTEGYQLQILIDGNSVDQVGNIDISQPLSYKDPNIVNPNDLKDDSVPVLYYLGDSQAMYIVPQTVLVDPDKIDSNNNVQSKAIFAIKRVLAGPLPDSSLSSPIPKKTKLLGLTVDAGVATVDFSKELIAYGGGSAQENMLLNTILYTLTAQEQIISVQILVEGEKQEYLPEGSDSSVPLLVSRPVNKVPQY